MTYLWVAIGSALGGIARYGLTRLASSASGTFPWGTMAINVIGCFIMGFVGTLEVLSGRIAIPESVRLLLMVGICGGFTTFSSFSLDTFAMMRTGDWFKAATNVTLSVDGDKMKADRDKVVGEVKDLGNRALATTQKSEDRSAPPAPPVATAN